MPENRDRGLTRNHRIDDRSKIDPEKRTVELAFSSECSVERWGENEVLSHEKGDYDFSRLNDSHPLLLGHNESDPLSQIGVIESARVDADKIGRAKVRFSKSPLGEQIFQDVRDGIRRLVSIGYDRTSIISSSKDNKGKVTTRYRWQPSHIAIVPVPADTVVGVGRDKPAQQHLQMKPELDDIEEIRNRTGALKRDRPDVAEQLDATRDRAIAEGWSLAQWTETIFKSVLRAQPPKQISLVSMGCNERERAGYSFTRAIQNCVENNCTIPKGCFEGEIHQEMTKRNLGFRAEGFIVPSDAPIGPSRSDRRRMQRDMQVNIFGQGGASVATELITPIIEVLRNRMWSDRLGVRTMAGLEGNVVIPRQTAPGTAYSVSEIAALTLSNQQLDQIPLIPKRVGATGTYSKQLVLQSSLDVESFMRDDFLKVIAIDWDRLILNGQGANSEPLGIMNTPGVGSVTFGGAADWAHLVNFETSVATLSADIGPAGFVTSPAVRGKLKTAAKLLTGATTVAAVPLWDNSSEEPWIGNVAGYPAIATNQVPNNQVVFGVFNQVILGLWGGYDVVIDPFTLAKQAEVNITVNTWGDVALRHPQSFTVSADSGAQ